MPALFGSNCGQCTTESVESNNFIIEPWTNLHLEIDTSGDSPSAVLDNYNPEIHDSFFFVTKFHDCGDGSAYISLKSLKKFNGVRYYLGNTENFTAGDLVGLVPDNNQPFVNNQDPRLFKYSGSDSVDLTALETKNNYVSPGSRNSVVYLRPENFWVTWPFITRTAERIQFFTFFKAKLRNNYIYVYISPGNRIRLVDDTHRRFSHLTTHDLQFEIIQWRMYMGFDVNRNIITSTAIVLRKPNSQWYITLESDEGEISMPQQYCFYKNRRRGSRRNRRNRRRGSHRRERVCIKYQKVEYRFHNDVVRSRTSTFIKEDIRDQHALDSRFFEALDNPDGTHRFRSALDPRKYLAILDIGSGRYQLVVLELNEHLGPKANYDFNVDVPFVSRDMKKSPKLPCPPDVIPRPELFECLHH